MMNRFLHNHLLLVSVFLIAAYSLAAYLVPNPHVARAAALMLVIASIAMASRYFPTVVKILFKGLRSDEQGGENSHLAVYGAFLVAAGCCIWGTYRIIYSTMGDITWNGNPVSGVGPAVAACGFILLFVSPDSIGPGLMLRTRFWQITVLILALMASFIIGTNFNSP